MSPIVLDKQEPLNARRKIPLTPGQIRVLGGQDTIDAFYDLFDMEVFCDCEELKKLGLSSTEIRQYIWLLSVHAEVRSKVDKLARHIFSVLKESWLIQKVLLDIPGVYKRIAESKKWKKLQKQIVQDASRMMGESSFYKLISIIETLIYSQVDKTDDQSYKTETGTFLLTSTFVLLSKEIAMQVDSNETIWWPEIVLQMQTFFGVFKDLYKASGFSFSIEIASAQKRMGLPVLSTLLCHRFLETMSSLDGKTEEEKRQQIDSIKERSNGKFESLRQFFVFSLPKEGIFFNRIYNGLPVWIRLTPVPETHMLNGVQGATFVQFGFDTLATAENCVTFSASSIKSPEVNIPTSARLFTFLLSRSGDACISSTNVPLSYVFEEADTERFRWIAISALEQYFSTQESLWQSNLEESHPNADTMSDAHEVPGLNTVLPTSESQVLSSTVQRVSGDIVSGWDDGNAHVHTRQKRYKDEARAFRALWVMPSRELIAKFTQLLGPPRITGSHHVFSVQGGRSICLPLHGQVSVGPWIISNTLRALGKTAFELMDDFGEKDFY